MPAGSNVTRLAILLALAAGCGFSPSLGEGAVTCGADDACPSGFQCCGGACFRECPAQDSGGPADAGQDSAVDGGGCADDDQDGVCNEDDNCLSVANPGQGDCDDDDNGDACDPVFTSACVTLRGTLSSAGGSTDVTGSRVIGVLGEPAHTSSSGNGFSLRGGLLPKSTGAAP